MEPMSNVSIPPEDENPNGNYTGENIKILEGLEAVRLRPAMYIVPPEKWVFITSFMRSSTTP